MGQRICHMKCVGRNMWASEKYIMTEVFDPSGQSESAERAVSQPPWTLAHRGKRPTGWETGPVSVSRGKNAENQGSVEMYRCLQHRAKAIRSYAETYQEEMISYLDSITSTSRNLDRTIENDTRKLTSVCLPFVKSLGERIHEISISYDIQTIFTSGSTLRSYLFRFKPPPANRIQHDQELCVLHLLKCSEVYKGETCHKK